MRQFGNTTHKPAVCRDCNGDGIITVPGIHLGHNRYADDTINKCNTCEGEGMVTITRTVHVTITPKLKTA